MSFIHVVLICYERSKSFSAGSALFLLYMPSSHQCLVMRLIRFIHARCVLLTSPDRYNRSFHLLPKTIVASARKEYLVPKRLST